MDVYPGIYLFFLILDIIVISLFCLIGVIKGVSCDTITFSFVTSHIDVLYEDYIYNIIH